MDRHALLPTNAMYYQEQRSGATHESQLFTRNFDTAKKCMYFVRGRAIVLRRPGASQTPHAATSVDRSARGDHQPEAASNYKTSDKSCLGPPHDVDAGALAFSKEKLQVKCLVI